MLSNEITSRWTRKLVLHDSAAFYDLLEFIPIEFIKKCIINHALSISTKDNFVKLDNGEFINKPIITIHFYKGLRYNSFKELSDVYLIFHGDRKINFSGTQMDDGSFTDGYGAPLDMDDEKSMKKFYIAMERFGIDIKNCVIKDIGKESKVEWSE